MTWKKMHTLMLFFTGFLLTLAGSISLYSTLLHCDKELVNNQWMMIKTEPYTLMLLISGFAVLTGFLFLCSALFISRKHSKSEE